MEEKYIVALEVGSSKIRGALASIDVTGIVNILAVQEERMVDSVRYGQVKNIEEVSSRIEDICQNLENAKAIKPRRITSVYAGISGCTIGSVSVSDATDFGVETELTAQNIAELKKKTIEHYFSDNKDIYDILPYEYVIDNESTLQPVGRLGSVVKSTFKIIEGTPGIKSNLKRVLDNRLGLGINGYIVSAIAEADVVLTAEEKQLGSMMVDFGAETTTVAIYKGNVLRSLVTLPMGSRNITRDLMSLNRLEDQAEQIKQSIGVSVVKETPGEHSIEQDEFKQFIQARTGEIIANIIAQIEYAGLKASDLPSGIVLIGGGSRMKGFSDLVAEQSKMKVRMGTAPRNIRISDTSILADDVIDVISLIISAANDPQQCVSQPEVVVKETYPDRNDDGYYDDEDDGGSRIGNDDDLDDDIFIDGSPKIKGGKKQKDKEPKNPPKEPKPIIKKNPMFSRLFDRLSHLLDDDMQDEFGEDESNK